jgi:hypothetical protein
MTFAEAKDQVAQEEGHVKGWPYLVQYCIMMGEEISLHYEQAGNILEQHAASVREEACKCPECGSTHRICQNCMLITH